MENTNFFPFGKYFLVVEKTKEEDGKKARYKTLEKDLYFDAFEAIKKYILETGGTSLNNCYTLFVEDVDKFFFLFTKDKTADEKEDIFGWTWDERFTFDVVSSLDNVYRKAFIPKIILVFNKKEDPYYFRFQSWSPILVDNVTKEEVMCIKEFEKGLGVVYDSTRWENIK